MKNNFYKHGAATLVGASLLLAAGCQNNNTQSSSSSKSKSSVVKIEKKSKSNKASSNNKQSSINEESSQSSTKSVEKKNDKLPTAAELMQNVSSLMKETLIFVLITQLFRDMTLALFKKIQELFTINLMVECLRKFGLRIKMFIP